VKTVVGYRRQKRNMLVREKRSETLQKDEERERDIVETSEGRSRKTGTISAFCK